MWKFEANQVSSVAKMTKMIKQTLGNASNLAWGLDWNIQIYDFALQFPYIHGQSARYTSRNDKFFAGERSQKTKELVSTHPRLT